MEILLLILLLLFSVILNIIGAFKVKEDDDALMFCVGLALTIVVSLALGACLNPPKQITQCETKHEWKARLQITEVGEKKDTTYIYNLKDTVK